MMGGVPEAGAGKGPKRLRILHLEDDPLDAELIIERLRQEGIDPEVKRVVRRGEFEAAIEGGRFDLVLADYSLPDFDGLTALRIAIEKRPEVPFIFVSGVLGEELAIETLKGGATDYVLKARLGRLVPSVLRALREAGERSERERLMREIEEQGRLLQAVVDNAPAGIALLSGKDLRIRWHNEAFRDHYDDPALGRELRGLAISEILPRARESGVEEIFRRVAESGVPFSDPEYEFAGFRRGVTYWRWSLLPLAVEGGGVPDLMIVGIEVTEQVAARRRQEELAAAAEANLVKLQAVLASMTEGLVLADLEGRILTMNPAARGILGCGDHPSSLRDLGESFTLLDPEGRPLSFEEWPLRRALRGEVFSDLEFRLPGTGGSPARTISFSGAPVRTGAGDMVLALITLRDITLRKRFEEDLNEAKAQAEAANRAKDQFLAVLSHELRNPLTPVLAAVSVTSTRRDVPEDLRRDLEMIRRNVELEARLIDDLLDLTRIAKGRLHLQPRVISAHDSISYAVEICRSEIQAKGISLAMDLRAADHFVEADPVRLEQVFWNLIKNSVKFSPPGGRIVISSESGGGLLRIRVADSGIGIEPEVLSRIFGAFEQGERAERRQFGGLGLGLAISKALVDLSGGKISAESEGEGKGATFTVELSVVERPSGKEPGALPSSGAARSQRSLKILLVEDHRDTALLMARLLEAVHHVVRTAGSIRSALEAAAAEPFDLVLSDLGLPDGSGLDLMRELKARHHLKGIALSGYGMDDDLQRSKDAGFSAHLTKPVEFSKLRAAIEELAG